MVIGALVDGKYVYKVEMIITQLDHLYIGGPKPFHADGTFSAMARQAVDAPVMLTKLGFVGDQVADMRVHGGPDKAVHFYPAEHYPFWREQLSDHPILNRTGAFGENLSSFGLCEDEVKIGDRFRIGKAIVEIAQGRQPCWKLDHHFGMKIVTELVIKTGRCGLYFRIIEEGVVATGDRIEQIETADHDWTVARTFRLLIGGGHKRSGAQADLRALAALDTLADVWRARAEKLLQGLN